MKRELNRWINDLISAFLSVGILIGFFWSLWMLMTTEQIPTGAHDVLLVLLGALVTNLNSVYQYMFGSSKGSEQKSQTLSTMISNAGPTANPQEIGVAHSEQDSTLGKRTT